MRMALVPIRDYESCVINNEARSFKMGLLAFRHGKADQSLKMNMLSLNFAIVHSSYWI
jgi:hypothetical protein